MLDFAGSCFESVDDSFLPTFAAEKSELVVVLASWLEYEFLVEPAGVSAIWFNPSSC